MENKEWIFSGVGVALVAGIIRIFVKKAKKETQTQSQQQTVNINFDNSKTSSRSEHSNAASSKDTTNILFIDDQKFDHFRVLKNAGWSNTKTIKDVKRIDCQEILWADVVFVDINGVGGTLFPQEQGLGVARQIKTSYPKKHVIIYSAQPQELRKDFSLFDGVLSKNADPYEYINILDNYLSNLKQ